jgi:hypothetical protein
MASASLSGRVGGRETEGGGEGGVLPVGGRTVEPDYSRSEQGVAAAVGDRQRCADRVRQAVDGRRSGIGDHDGRLDAADAELFPGLSVPGESGYHR